jgi:uncharacterized repeat protein (TIGR01451 family)
MSSTAIRGARTLLLAGLAAAFAAITAQAQTPEGTTIRNIATADYEDANGNSYTQVADTVDITVGFQEGIDVTPDGSAVAPASPSAGNTIAFTVENVGNGVDTVTVSEVLTDGSSAITITNYNWNAGDYGTIALLNAALSLHELAMGDTELITITYSVAADKGGETANYELTATSVRVGTESDPGDYDINMGETYGVSVVELVSGVDTTTANLLPGTGQTVVFTVTNDGNGTESFDLLTSQVPGTMLSVTAMSGTGVSQGGDPDSARVTDLGAGASVDVTVTFDVADLAAGTVDSLFFLARSVAQPATLAEGAYIVTLVKPSLTISKQAWDAARSAQIAGNVLPGETVWYRIEVTNGGTANAENVVVTDALPGEVTYVGLDDPDSSWDTLGEAAGTVTGTLTTLGTGLSDLFWIQVTIN